MDPAGKPKPFFKAVLAIKSAILHVMEFRILLIWLACASLATYSGPFGTYMNHSSVVLFATWLLLIGASILVAYVTFELCRHFLTNVPPFLSNVIYYCVGSIMMGSTIDFLLVNIIGAVEPAKPTRGLIILYCLSIMCFVQLVRMILLGGPAYQDFISPQRIGGAKRITQPPPSRLSQRLDIPRDVRIDHVNANGHFVDVFTKNGRYRTRMRFADAIAELDDSDGLNVHRSHWVNRDAIRGWVPDTTKPYILLENGTRVPVSKTKLDHILSAGLSVLEDPQETPKGTL